MHNCPSDIELSLLAEGSLSSQESDRIRRHISSCLHCAQVLLTVQELGLLEESALLPSVDEQERNEAAAMIMDRSRSSAFDPSSGLGRLLHWLKEKSEFTELLPDPVPVLADSGVSELCAIQCEWQVLKEIGCEIPLDQLVEESVANGWYQPGRGTPIACLGNLLELHGLQVERIHDASAEDLKRLISMGRRVIVAVDRGEMEADTLTERIMEGVEELFMQKPDHAVRVFEIVTDPSGTAVRLSDSSSEDFTDPIPWKIFKDAWDDSDRLLVSAWQDEENERAIR